MRFSSTKGRFNPCFSGTRARRHPSSSPPAMPSVSILFFWNSRAGHHFHFCPINHHSVSNPCFLELASGRYDDSLSTASWISICFSGTRARTLWNGSLKKRNSGFNPCFSGTRARTLSFSQGGTLRIWFQSLFFWNSRPDRRRTPDEMLRIVVSILVFLELAPGQRATLALGAIVVEFQSLFFWNSRPDTPSTFQTTRPTGFNPCFSGTRARTVSKSGETERYWCFNPCFSGTRARTELIKAIMKLKR